MKKYYTLVEEFISEQPLSDYLRNQNIHFEIGADYGSELHEFGFKDPDKFDKLLSCYRVLIEEHELSAILLSVKGVKIIRNRSGVNLKNKFRRLYAWIVD